MVDYPLTEYAKKRRLMNELKRRGESVLASDSLPYLEKTARLLGFDPTPFIDRDVVIYW